MAELLYIVARHEPGLYHRLRSEFSDTDLVQVTLDRRVGERRRQEVSVPIERRRRDRRRQDVTYDLQTLGWALLQVRPMN